MHAVDGLRSLTENQINSLAVQCKKEKKKKEKKKVAFKKV